MKKDQDFTRLLNKLNTRLEIQDKEALWNELEPRLPKEKKRRPFILWFGTGLIMLSAFFGIWYYSNNGQTLKSEDNFHNQAPLIVHDVHSPPLSSHASNHVEEKTTLKATNPQKKEEPTEVSQNKTSSVYIEEVAQSNFFLERRIHKDITPMSNVENQKTSESNGNNPALLSDYLNKSKELNYSLNGPQDIKFQSTDLLNKTSEPSFAIQGKNDLSNDLTQRANIKNLRSLPIYINPLIIEYPNIVIEGSTPDAFESQENNPWNAYISTYATGLTNSKSHNSTSEYGEQLSDLSDIKLGYSIGLEGGIKKSNGFILGLGAERTILFDKFRLNESFTIEENITNPAAFRHNGTLISKDDIRTRTISQNVLNYNQFTQWNIWPMIGYSIDKDVNIRFSVAPMFNLSKTYSGFLIDENDMLIQDLSDLFSNQKFSYSGYMLNSSISKNITSHVDLGLNIVYQNRQNNTALNNEHFNIGIKSIGIGFLLTYTFQ